MKTSAILLGMALLMGFGCENDDLKPIEKECFEARQTIKTASNAKGVMLTMEKDEQVIWYILSLEGIIGYDGPTYDSRDLVIPCNVPNKFKAEGLRITFSGQLKDTGQDFGDFSHIYYGNLNDIQIMEDNIL